MKSEAALYIWNLNSMMIWSQGGLLTNFILCKKQKQKNKILKTLSIRACLKLYFFLLMCGMHIFKGSALFLRDRPCFCPIDKKLWFPVSFILWMTLENVVLHKGLALLALKCGHQQFQKTKPLNALGSNNFMPSPPPPHGNKQCVYQCLTHNVEKVEGQEKMFFRITEEHAN